MKSKKFAIYAKKNFALIKMKKKRIEAMPKSQRSLPLHMKF